MWADLFVVLKTFFLSELDYKVKRWERIENVMQFSVMRSF